MIKTSSQVVTAFLGEPHPHSARVGYAFSRGWGDILRSYEFEPPRYDSLTSRA
ncbi:MAG: hypothetical protein ABSE84_17825 [Isosphaeraceae bacterium]